MITATTPATAPDLDKLPVPDVMKDLDVDPQTGLTSSEAQSRLTKYGPNALEEKKNSQWAALFAFFWGSDSLDD